MNLEETIIEAETSALFYEREADRSIRHGGQWYEEKAKACKATAEESRQIAEWLKELYAYRKTYPNGIDRFSSSDTPQTDCPWK